MAPHSSTLAWKIPWTEERGRLQSMGSLARLHFHFHFSLSCIGEGNGNPLQYSCLENPRDGGAWWAAVYGVTQSGTRLKQLSSCSSSSIEKETSRLFNKRNLHANLTEEELWKIPKYSVSKENLLKNGPVVETLCFHYRGCRFNPWLRN